MEHPSGLAFGKSKTSILEIPPVSSNKQEIRFNKEISIHYGTQDETLKLWLKNPRKEVVGYSESSIEDIANKAEVKVVVKNKNQKEIGRIVIESSKNSPPPRVLPPNPDPTSTHQKPHSQQPAPLVELMISFSILRSVGLASKEESNLYYKVVFKFQRETYETPLNKRMQWNYTLTACVNNNVEVDTPFVLLELWGAGANSRLLGVAKWETKGLVNLMTNGVTEVNLQPVLLYDSNLCIKSLSAEENIGYLTMRVSVGTHRQISRHLEAYHRPPQSSTPASSHPSHLSPHP